RPILPYALGWSRAGRDGSSEGGADLGADAHGRPEERRHAYEPGARKTGGPAEKGPGRFSVPLTRSSRRAFRSARIVCSWSAVMRLSVTTWSSSLVAASTIACFSPSTDLPSVAFAMFARVCP